MINAGYLLLLPLASALATSEPKLPTSTTDTDPEERWLNVRINHNSGDTTYRMRFFYNRVSQTASNIVIVVGGDWAASPGWTAGGLAADIARTISGSLFYAEHRFYGESRVSNDTSLSQLQFLTIDQSLEDLSEFIYYIKSEAFEAGRYKSGTVVLVGCAFGGSLATWMRLKFPTLVQAVVADGGPLCPKQELPEFFDVVNAILKVSGGDACWQSVKQAMADILEASNTPAGRGKVTELFNTCTAFTAATHLDTATFWMTILDRVTELLKDIDTLPEWCEELNDINMTPMERLANYVHQRQGVDNCVHAQYSDLVHALSDTSYDSKLAYMRLSLYESCTQRGWFPVGGQVPAEFYYRLCKDVFNEGLYRHFQLPCMSRTNQFYAGMCSLPSYVVSVKGTWDPYASLGPDATDATSLTPVYVVKGAPSCSVLRSSKSPTEENLALKIRVMNDIQKFIDGFMFAGAARTVSSVAFFWLVLVALL